TPSASRKCSPPELTALVNTASDLHFRGSIGPPCPSTMLAQHRSVTAGAEIHGGTKGTPPGPARPTRIGPWGAPPALRAFPPRRQPRRRDRLQVRARGAPARRLPCRARDADHAAVREARARRDVHRGFARSGEAGDGADPLRRAARVLRVPG